MYPREGDWFAPLPMGIHTVGTFPVGTWTWEWVPPGERGTWTCLPLPWGGRYWGRAPRGSYPAAWGRLSWGGYTMGIVPIGTHSPFIPIFSPLMKLSALVCSTLFLFIPSSIVHAQTTEERMHGGPCSGLTPSQCEREQEVFTRGPCIGMNFFECENFCAIQYEDRQP